MTKTVGRRMRPAAYRAAMIAALGAATFTVLVARQQNPAATVSLDSDDIGGVVTSTKGPEAGVWVIAETKDLPTGFRKIVVTDDRGRYVIPDLPKAKYSIWVRGYGLVDSPREQATPGTQLNLTALIAPTPAAAAVYYPAAYWYSLLEPPKKSEFPGTGPRGNGIGVAMKTQEDFLGRLTNISCLSCHQMGDRVTRELPKTDHPFHSSAEAWDTRVQFGQSGAFMSNDFSIMGRPRAARMFAEWTDRIAKGALPPAPPRPKGIERQVVITEWDWGEAQDFVHDEISTDETNPTINPYGPIYGTTEFSQDHIKVLDPRTNSTSTIPLPMIDYNSPKQWARSVEVASPYWGEEVIWNSKTASHNPVFDNRGRLWVTSIVSPPESQPKFCTDGSVPSSRLRPLAKSERSFSTYDPRTKVFTPIRTCFGTHHLAMDYSKQQRVWADSGGYLDLGTWDKTHDPEKSQGWPVWVVDTNGNGKRDDFVAADAPADPTKDTALPSGGGYDVATGQDGSVWFVSMGTPGRLLRLAPGATPELDGLTEMYYVPLPGHSTRGIEVDRNGVAWVGLGSGHLASFDRRKCKIINGPKAITGTHCPEGWSFYADPAPRFQGTDNGTDSHYQAWVDKFNTFGLGEQVPWAHGSNSDSLLAMPKPGQWIVLRVPYPMGYFAKGMDGRIDDPKAGWKGRAVWSTYSGQPMWHQENGKGSTGHVLKFQLRPDPLAK